MYHFYLHQQVASFSAYLLCVILKTKSINYLQVNFCKAGWNESCAVGECCLNFLYVISNKLVQKLYQRLRTGKQSSRHKKLWVGEVMQRSQKPAGACLVTTSPQDGVGRRFVHKGAAGQEPGSTTGLSQLLCKYLGKLEPAWNHCRWDALNKGDTYFCFWWLTYSQLRYFYTPPQAAGCICSKKQVLPVCISIGT